LVSFTLWPLYPRERLPGSHWIGGWVGLRDGLDDVEKKKFLMIPGLEIDPSVVQPISSRFTDCAVQALAAVILILLLL
jgi:hypothetical protein